MYQRNEIETCNMTMERTKENERAIMERAQRLYRAALNGDLPALFTLIEEDPLILHKAPNILVDEILPLHVAAVRGDIDFTKAVLDNAPYLTSEQDSLGRTPLHWASALGHLDVVRELLKPAICKDICLICDYDGKNPLYIAVIKGKTQLIPDIYQANPESARHRMGGDTVFHLCLKHHRLDALKLLVELICRDMEFIFLKDGDGNTILHLAAIFRQLETTKYLINLDEERKFANLKNGHGLTTLDMIDYYPRDPKGIEIREVLVQAGIHSANNLNHHLSASSSTVAITAEETSEDLNGDHANAPSFHKTFKDNKETWVKPIWEAYLKINNDWFESAKGNLMVVATVIAAAAFQAGINPPGGVWQDSGYYKPKNITYTAGTSIAGSTRQYQYNYFVKQNTISFVASLSVILLLMSGAPLKNKVIMLALAIGLLIAIVCLVSSYSSSLCMLASDIQIQTNNSCKTAMALSSNFTMPSVFVAVCLCIYLIVCIINLMCIVYSTVSQFSCWLAIKLKRGVEAMKIKLGS